MANFLLMFILRVQKIKHVMDTDFLSWGSDMRSQPHHVIHRLGL